MGDGGSRNFYERVERKLEVLEADGKEILQRISKLEGGAPQPPDTLAQILQRIAKLETKQADQGKEQDTTSNRLWEIVKYVLTAAIGGAIGAWLKGGGHTP